jgi:hypothetical protein
MHPPPRTMDRWRVLDPRPRGVPISCSKHPSALQDGEAVCSAIALPHMVGTQGLREAMNQFAAEGDGRKLRIRRVSGLCNQSVFKHFRKRCNPPNLYCSGYSRTSRLASPGSQDDASMSIVSDLRIFVRSRYQARKLFPTNGLTRTGVLLTPSVPSPAPSEIQQPMKNRRIQRVPKNAGPDW